MYECPTEDIVVVIKSLFELFARVIMMNNAKVCVMREYSGYRIALNRYRADPNPAEIIIDLDELWFDVTDYHVYHGVSDTHANGSIRAMLSDSCPGLVENALRWVNTCLVLSLDDQLGHILTEVAMMLKPSSREFAMDHIVDME